MNKYTQKKRFQQCFDYWNFEHIENRCTATRKCENYTFDDYDKNHCTNSIRKCANCADFYFVDSRECRHVIAANQKKARVAANTRSQLFNDFDKKLMSSFFLLFTFIFNFDESIFLNNESKFNNIFKLTNTIEETKFSTNEFLERNATLLKFKVESQLANALIFVTFIISNTSHATKEINKYLLEQFVQTSQRNEKSQRRINEFAFQTLIQLIQFIQIINEQIRRIHERLNNIILSSVSFKRKNTRNNKYSNSDIFCSNKIIKASLLNRKRKTIKINISFIRVNKKVKIVNKHREFEKKIESIVKTLKSIEKSDHENAIINDINNINTSESTKNVVNEYEINNAYHDSTFSFFTKSNNSNDSLDSISSIKSSKILIT